jgi:hypothetical protein
MSAGTENVERQMVRRPRMLDYDLIVGIVGLAKSRSEVRYNLTKLVLSIQGTWNATHTQTPCLLRGFKRDSAGLFRSSRCSGENFPASMTKCLLSRSNFLASSIINNERRWSSV